MEHTDEQEVTGDRRQLLQASQVIDIFKKMSVDDVRTIGLDDKWSRPEWLCVSVLPGEPRSEATIRAK